MIVLPRQRLNFADQLSLVHKPVAEPIGCRLCYFTLPEQAKLEGLVGEGSMDIIRKLLRSPSRAVGKIINNVISGKTSTALKNAISVLDRDPTKRRQHVGEKHAPLQIGKTLGMANFMGPGTKLNLRLRNKDPARTMSDRVAMAHDIRYALSTNIGSIRQADNKMIRKLKEIRRLGQDTKWNTSIGLRGIQGKKLLENIGVLKRDLFLAPGKDINEAALRKKLRELELKGFGKPILPGEVLKQRIMLKLRRERKGQKPRGKGHGRIIKRVIRGGRHKKILKGIRLKGKRGGRRRIKGRGRHVGRGLSSIDAAKLIVKRLLPQIINQVVKLGIPQVKKLTTKIKDNLIDKLAKKIQLKVGGVIGVLGLTLLTSAVKFLPVAKDIAELITPVLFKLFGFKLSPKPRLPGRRGGRGKGLATTFGIAIAKLLFDLIRKKVEGKGLHGRGVLSSILKAGKIIAKLIKKALPFAKPIIKGAFETIKFLTAIKKTRLERKRRKRKRKFAESLFQEIL